MAKKQGYLGESGYFLHGWIETDELGKPIVGTYGLRIYRHKKDIVEEGFDWIGKAMLVVELPDLSKRKTPNLT